MVEFDIGYGSGYDLHWVCFAEPICGDLVDSVTDGGVLEEVVAIL
jgi:hypothetical protein